MDARQGGKTPLDQGLCIATAVQVSSVSCRTTPGSTRTIGCCGYTDGRCGRGTLDGIEDETKKECEDVDPRIVEDGAPCLGSSGL